jgi:hypothetical protein
VIVILLSNSVLPSLYGLQPTEWLTLLAIILGPLFAVIVTILFEAKRRSRDQRLQVFRILMTTRHLPGDANYSNSINLVPIEFHDNRQVINAYNAYIDAVRFKPAEGQEETNNRLLSSKQTKLIYEVAKDLGFKLRESDLEVQAYAAEGFIQRDNRIMDALSAMRNVADILWIQTRLLGGESWEDIQDPKSPNAEKKPPKDKKK